MHTSPLSTGLLYGLNDRVPRSRLPAYALQHMIYFLAGCSIMPVAVGAALGLGQAEIATMLQRTFFLSGAVSILQTLLGHRYPIIDGPSGLWMGMVIVLAASAASFGKPLALLRTDLEMGMIVAGGVVALIGLSGLMPSVAKIFNPLVNGTFLMLMVLQLSASVMRGATGVSGAGDLVSGRRVVAFLVTTAVIVFVNMKCAGFLKSIATLVGVAVGWVTALLLGLASGVTSTGGALLSLPELFAWGRPTFDLSVTLTCVLGGILLFSNLVASINGLAQVVGETPTASQLSRATVIYGGATALTGLMPTVGYVPFASSMGITAMTGVAARLPFLLGSGLMILLGLIAPVGAFFASIPTPVGYAAMMVVFSLILGQAIGEFHKVEFTNRESMIVGISSFIGVGVMFLPSAAFSQAPQMLRYILSNGLVDGTLSVIFLEHILLSRRHGT